MPEDSATGNPPTTCRPTQGLMSRRFTASAAPGTLASEHFHALRRGGSVLEWAVLGLASLLFSFGHLPGGGAHAPHRSATSQPLIASAATATDCTQNARGASLEACATQRRISARFLTAPAPRDPELAALRTWPDAPRFDRHVPRYAVALAAPPFLPRFLLVSRLLI